MVDGFHLPKQMFSGELWSAAYIYLAAKFYHTNLVESVHGKDMSAWGVGYKALASNRTC